jgi:hypothetical protein
LAKSSNSIFLKRSYLSFLFGIISIALSLGWGKFVGKEVYFPLTDYVDVALGCMVGGYLLFLFFSGLKNSRTTSEPVAIGVKIRSDWNELEE